MQKNLHEVTNCNQKPSMTNVIKSSLKYRGCECINGIVNDLGYELKKVLRYEWSRFLDYMFSTSK